jgi:hypothetical protein
MTWAVHTKFNANFSFGSKVVMRGQTHGGTQMQPATKTYFFIN